MKHLVLVVMAVFSLSACVTTGGQMNQGQGQGQGSTYSAWSTGQTGSVETGVVTHVRVVAIEIQKDGTSYGAMALGGTAGAALGSKVGRGKGKTLATIAGGVLGTAGANAYANRKEFEDGLEFQVKMDNGGRTIVLVQPAREEYIRAGQRVRLITMGGRTRATAM